MRSKTDFNCQFSSLTSLSSIVMIYRLFVIALILIISIKQSGNIVIINITSKNVTVKSTLQNVYDNFRKREL